MARRRAKPPATSASEPTEVSWLPSADVVPDQGAIREILGYLNFSGGSPDPRFQANLNQFARQLLPDQGRIPFLDLFLKELGEKRESEGAFTDTSQARAVLGLVFGQVLPAYRRHHADLLAHVPESWFYSPLFVARVCEATLAQGGPWDAVERIVEGAVAQLNDYIGHRPVAVLENRRRMQPYPHERFRPVPLFLKNVGVACCPYTDLVRRMLEIIQTLPETMRREAHFEVPMLDELALDLRAYDNSHPVYRRTNYLFGEWDPHLIDISGRYRRFVVREVILAALQSWVDEPTNVAREERLSEAAAVLAGTMLMASAISGSGPDTHSSSISLTTLLPKVARQRDAFYQQLLQSMTGKHAERLRREAKVVQQPFGKIRQHLNLFLANHGCQQLQRSHLSWLYSRMGYGDAARRQAKVIPAVSSRFESEIQLHISEALILLEGPDLEAASAAILQAEQLFHRGIECGALVDPWNIIGFQAHYPLFTSREDSVPDQRVDRLLILLEQLFKVTGRLVSEAAAVGRVELVESVLKRFDTLAAWWDQFASTIVTDLHPVHGGAEADAARRVSRVLLAWHSAGESAGDVGFWKQHLADLDTPIAYGTVIELLLRKRDLVASMNLLIQWLSQGDTVPLQQGLCDFRTLFECWIELATSDQMPGGPPERWNRVRVFFERIEVNAGDWGMAPQLTEGPGGKLKISGDALTGLEHPLSATPFNPFELPGGETDPDSPENVFGAAYEGVVFRDSANDGQAGDTADDGPKPLETDLDLLVGPLERRVRFLATVSGGWTRAARWAMQQSNLPAEGAAGGERQAVLDGWRRQNDNWGTALVQLVERLNEWQPADPGGDPDSLSEYDRELHIKHSLLGTSVNVVVELQENSRVLRMLSTDALDPRTGATFEEQLLALLANLSRRQVAAVKRQIGPVLRQLAKLPLLYTPLDRGGRVRDLLAARNLQGVLRSLLGQLPRLGLFKESWDVLRTAYNMERSHTPGGMSITEFDRLVEHGLSSLLQVVLSASRCWRAADRTDRSLTQLFSAIVEPYMELWMKHSATMRLSTVEWLNERETWREVKQFISNYGADLFHPRMLAMGNLRAIVQRGAEEYLAYLEQNDDPLHPIRLLAEIDYVVSRRQAAETLELILRIVVEKFDRFLEYNSTTTHSDYGDQLHCLLDFVRLEADYDRYDWNLRPVQIAHDVLARAGLVGAARLWQKNVERNTLGVSKSFHDKLKRIEKQHGMRLPSVTDRIGEKFVKPLQLDSILSLVRPSMFERRAGGPLEAFAQLEPLVEDYLQTSSGSALDVQPWMQSLTDEVDVVDEMLETAIPVEYEERPTAEVPITPEEILAQLTKMRKPTN